MDSGIWFSFLIAALLISLSPGAGAVAAMSSRTLYGWRGGVGTIAGLQLGALLHLTLVALGLGAVIAASPRLFDLIRWVGCVYLAYLGLRLIFERPRQLLPSDYPRLSSYAGRVLRGFLVNATNPKAIVFMLAVVPPFVNPQRPLWSQYGIMAVTMVIVDLGIMSAYMTLGSRLLTVFRSPRHARMINGAFGVVFLLAAVWLGIASHPMASQSVQTEEAIFLIEADGYFLGTAGSFA